MYKKAREEFLNAIERGGESPALWAEFDTLKEGGDISNSPLIGDRRAAVGNDKISEESPRSDSTGGTERSRGYTYGRQEIDALLSALQHSINHVDESGGVNSSKLAGCNIDLNTKEGWEIAKEAIMERSLTKQMQSYTTYILPRASVEWNELKRLRSRTAKKGA